MNLSYTIGDPVDQIPPVVRTNAPREHYGQCYGAAKEAKGKWVPITMPDIDRAKRFASVARKRHGVECESRGRVVFLRVTR